MAENTVKMDEILKNYLKIVNSIKKNSRKFKHLNECTKTPSNIIWIGSLVFVQLICYWTVLRARAKTYSVNKTISWSTGMFLRIVYDLNFHGKKLFNSQTVFVFFESIIIGTWNTSSTVILRRWTLRSDFSISSNTYTKWMSAYSAPVEERAIKKSISRQMKLSID